ncbi:MAG: MFS transporter [Sporolactobacillus sp.]
MDVQPLAGNVTLNKRFLIVLGFVMGLRELSMTMLNPFISVFGRQLSSSTPFLAGLALGIYGLTNGLFQVPYGIWSDRVGRKKVIILGLLQLFIGLLLAGVTHNIYLFIFARALQGSGAVMGVAYSWVGDTTPVEKSNEAMGFVGMIVAPSAVIAFVVGPMLYQIVNLRWLFIGASALVLAALIGVLFEKNEPLTPRESDADKWRQFWHVLRDKNLLLISFLGVIYNFIMACLFFVLPDQFTHYLSLGQLWLVFAPALLIGMIAMKVGTKDADHGHFKRVALFAYLFMGLGFVLLTLPVAICVWLSAICVMSGFMCLTTILPSFVNRNFPEESRGAANGVLQTFTFLGFFLGPTLAGLFVTLHATYLIYLIVACLSLVAVGLLQPIRVARR